MKLKQMFWNFRALILIAAIVFALVAINPRPWNDGAAIRNVLHNSTAAEAGIASPGATISPVDRERILAINNVPVKTVEDYYRLTSNLQPNVSLTIKTNKNLYRLTTDPIRDIGISVFDAPKSNIRLGLDLQGGTRVLLQPQTKLNKDDTAFLIDNMNQRLNLFGLSDVSIREAQDLSGNQYIVVEIAGVNEEEVKELLAKQGKFEAKIGNDTVFVGGKDITYVCRSAGCAGIDPQRACGSDGSQYYCGFRFSITLTQESGARQGELTRNLQVVRQPNGESFLEKPLDLYLDDQLVDTLNIGSELKGSAVTEISISGSGVGNTQQEAVSNTLQNMKRLQTILITGSLPVKLDVISTDSISPVLGQQFIRNAFLMGLVAIIAVILVLLVAYRNPIIAVPILITSLLEIFIMLGVAAMIRQNIDLAAIAGIIAAVGTGVNDQIIITDEAIGGAQRKLHSWKDKIKNAFFIIMGAYLTLLVAMIPLLFAGAGLLKGFALVTIIGISVGVFITRPAYAKMIEVLTEE